MAGCLRCRAELRDVTIVIGALRCIERDRIPDHLLPRVKRAVHHTMSAPKGMGHFWARVSVPVAVATAVAAIAFMLKGPVPHSLVGPAEGPAAKVGTGRVAAGARRPGQGGRMVRRTEPAPNPPLGIPGAGGGGPLTSPTLGSTQANKTVSAPDAAAPRAVKGEQPQAVGEGGRAPAPAPLTEPRPQAKLAAPPPSSPEVESATPKAAPAKESAGGAAPRLSGSATFAKPADLAQAAVQDEQAPPLAVSTHVGLSRKNGHRSITLQFSDRAESGEMKVTIGYGSATRTVLIESGDTAPIALTSRDLGAGPSAVPIVVQAGGRERSYILFCPVQARMGEVAAESPRAIYEGVSAKTVLLHFAAFTGLVILAEKPLDQPFVGEFPAGPPSDAIEKLARELDRTLIRESESVFLLSARQ